MAAFAKRTTVLMSVVCLCMTFRCQVSNVFGETKEEKAVYVGMNKCKTCHPEHVKTYSDWKYSKNFRILEMRGKDHDPQCLSCHTTGYGKKGGS